MPPESDEAVLIEAAAEPTTLVVPDAGAELSGLSAGAKRLLRVAIDDALHFDPQGRAKVSDALTALGV